MSANLKIRTMNTLLLGAALLTPLAAQDRNRNDRNDPRSADQGRFQTQSQRPNAAPQTRTFENRSGAQNRSFETRGGNEVRQENRNGNAFQGQAGRYANNDRSVDRNRNSYANRGNERDYRPRDNDRRPSYNDRSNYSYRSGYVGGYSRPYYVSRYAGRRWSIGEDRAYRYFLAERRLAYVTWDAFDPYEQDEYWDWRDSHPDNVLFSFRFGGR